MMSTRIGSRSFIPGWAPQRRDNFPSGGRRRGLRVNQ
jgi:hypothetical protein